MNPVRTILTLTVVIMCIVITTGCTSQPSAVDKTPPVTQNTYTRMPTLIPDPNSTPYVPGGNQISISNFSGFLAKWNEKMHWGYSPQQIENYSSTLEEGVLKKYKTDPNYPSLEIPDLKPFCMEVGDAMGLSKNQSEAFAIAADDDLRRAKIEFNQPLIPEPESKALTEPDTQSAPFAFGRIDYEYIFVDFEIPPVKPGKTPLWNSADITDASYDLFYGTNAISSQAPQQASITNTGGYWPPVMVEGTNPGKVEESMAPDGWMENAIRMNGFIIDDNFDGKVSDDFARYRKDYEGADSVVIVYCTHDAMGAYAAGGYWGYADKAAVSYWGWNGGFFDAVPGSYEHEIVHLYGAVDESNESSYCGEYSPFAVSPMKEMYKNTNHHRCTPHTDSSVMNDPYNYNIISQSSNKFIGWGDFDNDGTLDPLDARPWGINSKIGVFRNSSGTWYLDYNFDTTIEKSFTYGMTGDISVVGDWDGDEDSDIGVFRPSSGVWYLDTHKEGTTDFTFQFGKSGDIPVVGDWNADGISDAGVFRPSNGNWYLDTNKFYGAEHTFQFGKSGDIPVVGDWNADGISDAGVFRPSNGNWYLDTNKNSAVEYTFHFGLNGDIPVVGDWDDNGISDLGVFRPSSGFWYLETNKNGDIYKSFQFGSPGDSPKVGKWV